MCNTKKLRGSALNMTKQTNPPKLKTTTLLYGLRIRQQV